GGGPVRRPRRPPGGGGRAGGRPRPRLDRRRQPRPRRAPRPRPPRRARRQRRGAPVVRARPALLLRLPPGPAGGPHGPRRAAGPAARAPARPVPPRPAARAGVPQAPAPGRGLGHLTPPCLTSPGEPRRHGPGRPVPDRSYRLPKPTFMGASPDERGPPSRAALRGGEPRSRDAHQPVRRAPGRPLPVGGGRRD